MDKLTQMKSKTFTLIEMLIVIVIIGILAAALIPRIQSTQGRARDAKRVVDMNQIYTAMRIYYEDKGYLVLADGGDSNAGGWDYSSQSQLGPGARFLPWLTGYLTSVPLDPINNMTADALPTNTYAYRYYCYFPNNGLHLGYWKESGTGWFEIQGGQPNGWYDSVITKCG